MSIKQELEGAIQHQKDSENSLATLREKWLNFESMLLSEHREAQQNENKVFDPRVATIELERTARVAAQNPSGKAFSVSQDDIGKNMLMNMLLSYQMEHANEQWDFLIKQMMMSFWSRVYGSMFALTPWRIRKNYVGPELLLINIYDAFPQPGVSVQDADWFVVGNRISLKWLQDQAKHNPDVWNADEIRDLATEIGKGGGDVKQQDNTASYTQKMWYPTQTGDEKFPKIQTFTQYTGDKWITWAKRANTKKGREYLLRVVNNNDLEGQLPVVAKHSIPMFDGPMGLGPFQRGKSLQFGTNSLINMYLTSVREKLRPPRMVNPDNVVMSSLKFDPGAFWFMNTPGQDVVPFNAGQDPDATFNSAYGLMVSAMLNQAGTTDTTGSSQIESALGRTPQAIRSQEASKSAQDFWEQTMLENTLKQVMERWIMLNVKNLEAPQVLRLFGEDIERIAEMYPDIVEMLSENTGKVYVDRELFMEGEEPVKFDYRIETGSTAKPNLDKDIQDIIEIIQMIDERQGFMQKIQEEGYDVKASELLKEVLLKKGMREDRIIVQKQQEEMMQPGQEQMMPEQGMPPQQEQHYEDPEIEQVAQQLMGGMGGVPQQQ
jgi:hypothetical protein